MKRRSLTEQMNAYFQRERVALSDTVLLYRYQILLTQCKSIDRSDRVLIEYQNELEYRNLKYKGARK